MVPFDVQVVSILSKYLRKTIIIQMLALCKVNRHHKQVLLEQHLHGRGCDIVLMNFHELASTTTNVTDRNMIY